MRLVKQWVKTLCVCVVRIPKTMLDRKGGGVPFEEFEKRSRPSTSIPSVTVLAARGFAINKAAYDLLGNPEAVTLLYDPAERLVGFKPSSPDHPRAYAARPQGRSTAAHVSGVSFMKHYGIDASTTRRYAVQMRDGILVLDLESESTEISGPRKRRQERQAV